MEPTEVKGISYDANGDITSITVDASWADTDDLIGLDNITLPDYNWSNTANYDDIVLDGISLKETLKGLNDRLAILQVNPALEAEFDELHALGEQYRALERKLLEKKAVWNALNGN